MPRRQLATGVWKDESSYYVLARKRGEGKKEATYESRNLTGGRVELHSIRRQDTRVVPKNQLLDELLTIRRELMQEMQGSGPVRSLTIRTFADALELYENTPKKSGERRSFSGQRYRLDYLKDNYGNLPLPKVYEKLWRERERVEKGLHERSWSPSTMNRLITMAKTAMGNAYRQRDRATFNRLIDEDYLDGFPLLPEYNVNFLTLSNDQREAFWEALDPIYRPLYYVACRTPVRVSELLNLTRSNVNHTTGMMAVLHGGTTKNRASRRIVFWPEFEEYVRGYLDSPAEYFFNSGAPDYKPLGYFSTEYQKYRFGGRPMTDAWEAACTAAGVEGYNFHKTRQEAVMFLYREKYTIDQIMVLGGWKSRKAFDRYFNDELAVLIDKGVVALDTSWFSTYAEAFASFWKKAA